MEQSDQARTQQHGSHLARSDFLRDKPEQESRYWWRVIAVGAMALVFALGFIVLLWLMARPLALLFAAVVIATALAPVVDWLERWIPRVMAIILTYLAVLLVFIGMGWIIFPPMVSQAQELVDSWPELVERGRNLVDRWDVPGDERLSDRIIETVSSNVSRFGNTLVMLPLTIFNMVLEIILVIIMSIYWLIAAPAMRRFVLSLAPQSGRDEVAHVLSSVGSTMGGYVRGAVIDGIIVGGLTYIGLLIIGVDYAIVLALIAALFELVPVIGPILATIPIVGIALFDSLTTGVITLVFWLVMQQIASQLIEPNIMGEQTDLQPLLVVFALLVGSAIAGILGALIAIPLFGALNVLFAMVVAPAIRRWTGASRDLAPATGGESS